MAAPFVTGSSLRRLGIQLTPRLLCRRCRTGCPRCPTRACGARRSSAWACRSTSGATCARPWLRPCGSARAAAASGATASRHRWVGAPHVWSRPCSPLRHGAAAPALTRQSADLRVPGWRVRISIEVPTIQPGLVDLFRESVAGGCRCILRLANFRSNERTNDPRRNATPRTVRETCRCQFSGALRECWLARDFSKVF